MPNKHAKGLDFDLKINNTKPKILILTNYCTGSTQLVRDAASRYSVSPMFEHFNSDNHGKDFQYQFERLCNCNSYVVKVMPDQVTWEQLVQIIDHADYVFYLYREDFEAQAESWVGHMEYENQNRGAPTEDPPVRDCKTLSVDAEVLIGRLRVTYDLLHKCFKEFTFPVLRYEDLFEHNAFKQTYNWEHQINFPKLRVTPDFRLEPK